MAMADHVLKVTSAYGGNLLVPRDDQVIGASLESSGKFETDDIKVVQTYWFQTYGNQLKDTFIDIGANIGSHTIAALHEMGFNRGIAIEASERNYRLLKANLALRGDEDRVDCIKGGASNSDSSAVLYHNAKNCGDHRIGNAPLNNASQEKIKLYDTKPLLDMHMVNRSLCNSLCWIDTQGHELAILQSITPLIRDGLPVVIEFWPYGMECQGTDKHQFVNLLMQHQLDVAELKNSAVEAIAVEQLLHYWDQLRQADSGQPEGAKFSTLILSRKGYEQINFETAELKRIQLASSCGDCAAIPKVDHAGEIIHQDGNDWQVMHNGLLVLMGGYYGPWMSQIIRNLRGHHEPQEEAVFHLICQQADQKGLMIELGCYWSYYTMWFLHQSKNRKAIGVDIDDEHLKIGKQNLRKNGLENQVTLIKGVVDSGSDSEHLITTESGERKRVKGISLFDCYRIANQRIEILHCDAQGAEEIVVDQAIELARQGQVRFVVFSTHAFEITGNPLTHQECLQKLINAGCHIIAEHDVHESFSGDGLIVGSFDPNDRQLHVNISHNRTCDAMFASPAVHHKLALAEITLLKQAHQQTALVQASGDCESGDASSSWRKLVNRFTSTIQSS